MIILIETSNMPDMPESVSYGSKMVAYQKFKDIIKLKEVSTAKLYQAVTVFH